jgi:hypothetical protein
LGTKASALSDDIEILQDRLLDISDLVGYQNSNPNLWDEGFLGFGEGLPVDSGMNAPLDNGVLDSGMSTGLDPVMSGGLDARMGLGMGTGLDPGYNAEGKELNFEDFFKQQQQQGQ